MPSGKRGKEHPREGPPRHTIPGVGKHVSGEELAFRSFDTFAQGVIILNDAIVSLDPTGGAGVVKAAIEQDPLHPDFMAGAKEGGVQLTAGVIIPKGVNSSRLFSGITRRLETVIGTALGRGEVVITPHTANRYIERALSANGSLKGVTFEQVASTLKHGEFFLDNNTKNYVALRKGVAIAFSKDGDKVIIKTIEPGYNVKEGRRFARIKNPL